jgi:hypothetical protein
MNCGPGYTRAAIGMSRVFICGVAVIALAAGLAGVIAGEGGFFIGGIGLIVAGVLALLIAIPKDGNVPAERIAYDRRHFHRSRIGQSIMLSNNTFELAVEQRGPRLAAASPSCPAAQQDR